MNVEELRQRYPQYNDLTDSELVMGFHQKYYSDIPFDEFAKAVGFESSSNEEIDRTTGLKNLPLRIKLGFVDKPQEREALIKQTYSDTRRLPTGELVFVNPETNKLTTIDEEGRSIRDIADWVGMLPEAIGGTIGSIGGEALWPAGGGYVGAGGGTAIGKMVQKGISKKIMGEQAIPDEQYWKDVGLSGATGVIGEGGGRLITKVLSPFTKKVLPATKRAMHYFKKFGGRFTPAQLTETRILDVLENVAESSLLGGGRITAFKQGQQEIIENIAGDIAERFGARATAEEAGNLLQKTIMGNKSAFNIVAKRLYGNVDDLVGGMKVSTTKLKQQAIKLLKDMVPQTAEPVTKETASPFFDAAGRQLTKQTQKIIKKSLVPSLKNNTTVRILRDFATLPDEVPFKYLQQWRSDLMQVGYGPSDLIPGKTAGMAKYLAKQIDNAFSQAEGGLTGDALAAFKKANNFWKHGKQTFNNKFIKSIIQKDPELVARTVFKRGAVQQIKKIKQLVNERTWRRIRGVYLNDLLFKESVDKIGNISGLRLQANLRKLGEPTIKQIFNKQELKELIRFSKVAEIAQARATGLGGGMLIQLTQAGAIMAPIVAPSKGLTAGSAAILLGPAAMSHIFTNDLGIKWLTNGLVTKATTKHGINLAARLLALAGKENIQEIPYP